MRASLVVSPATGTHTRHVPPPLRTQIRSRVSTGFTECTPSALRGKVQRCARPVQVLAVAIPSDKVDDKPSSRDTVDESGVLQIRGGLQLEGVIPIGGAKNSALALLAGCLLCPDELVLHNVPRLRDILKMFNVIESVGATVRYLDGSAVVNASQLSSGSPAASAVQELRASFLVLGP
eukprot:CAMPEP_0198208588 /NCGR_PEP_ID=MMETSP1445-20131203/11936_1 /TAXON_ID=36898 /ORGANISM="Pyramimonas sp., Strain CCMP2087" /LENGTH=177 /DNA_ID=CAMNT_0043882039 /DNA_START=66 /DNA_END=595 /DNA_ORIENTATION=-